MNSRFCFFVNFVTNPHYSAEMSLFIFSTFSCDFTSCRVRSPLPFRLEIFTFFIFLIFSGDKRVLHYTYSEGAPLPTAQNKALQPLFFMPYSCFAFFSVFSLSFLIMFRIYSPTLGRENSKTGSAPIVFFGMSKL